MEQALIATLISIFACAFDEPVVHDLYWLQGNDIR